MTTRLSFATWDHDRAMPMHTGEITVAGFEFDSTIAYTAELFALAVGDAQYDISELSFSSYLIQLSRGDSQYVALPVYLSRAFRHGAVYVRTDAGVNHPQDLQGRAVGIPEYAMTLAVWVRGLLSDAFGVDLSALKYRTAGLNVAGRQERLKLDLPSSIDLKPLPESENLNDALLAGAIDAIISPAPPRAFTERDARVRRLLDPTWPAEQQYFKDTGVFPIMHVAGVKKSVADAHPGFCSALYDAFLEARRRAMARVKAVAEGSSIRTMSPWYADAYKAAVDVMGDDYWPYGVEGNRPSLDAILRYMDEQHLTARRLSTDEIFHPDTFDKPGT